MRKYTGFFILATLLLVQACKKDDKYAFNESPNARVTASLAGYQKILTDATTGWLGVLYPAGDTTKAYSFYFKFDAQNRVTMLSDFTDSFATKKRESSYRMKALQTPALIFDTYSYLHVLADPNPVSSGNGGSVGEGLNSDFEFALDSATTNANAITMIGRQHNSIMKLTKLTAAQAATVDASGFSKAQLFTNVNKLLTYFKRVTLNGVVYEVLANTVSRVIFFSYLDGSGNLVKIKAPYYYGVDGVYFSNPVTLGTSKISAFTDMDWDPVNLTLGFKINGTTTVKIDEAIAPLKLDKTAAQAWLTQMAVNFNGCWVSDNAYHVNGVDDYCKFKNITNFQNLWYAGPAVFGGTAEGLIAFTGALAAPYCGSKVTIIDGIARFTLVGSAGTFTGTGAPAVAMSAARLITYNGTTANSFQDWYLIPTTDDGLRYDMVRFTDAKAWISWRPR
jgi:hypothetical protein